MKKIITFLALLTFTAGAWADDGTTSSSTVTYNTSNYIVSGATQTADTVGEYSANANDTTYTSVWWQAFSDYYMIPEGYTLTLSFTNHCNENGKPVGGEYHNVTALMVTSNNVRGSSNEFIGLTNTNYCWKGLSDNHFSTGFPSDTTEMMKALNGATMIVKVARPSDEDSVYVTMEAKSSDGETLITQQMFNATEDSCTYLRAYLVVDSAMVTNLKSELKEGVDTSIDDGYPYPYISNGGEEVTSVGSSDYTTTWWSVFSSYYRIPTGYTVTINYKSHCNTSDSNTPTTSGYEYSPNLMVTTDGPIYNNTEFLGLATSGYGWKNFNNTDNYFVDGLPSDMSTLESAMNGASVVVKVANTGYSAIATILATSSDGNTVMRQQSIVDVNDDELLRAFLTLSYCYIDEISSSLSEGIDNEMGSPYIYIAGSADEETTVGAEDYSKEWWSDFSSHYRIPVDSVLTLKFTNKSSESNNSSFDPSNNEDLCTALMVTNDVAQTNRYDDSFGYSEYIGLTDGGNEWKGNADHTKSGFPSTNDSIAAALNNAEIEISIANEGSVVYVEMTSTSNNSDSTVMYQTATYTLSEESAIRAFLVVDRSYVSNLESSLSSLIYERANTSEGAYGTICLPYAATAEGATIYHVVGYGATTTTSDDGTTTETPSELYLEEVTAMEAGKGYVFCASDTSAITFTMSGTKVSEAVGDTLVGNLSTASLEVPDTCYILTSTENDGTTTYYWGKGKSNTVAQYRAYLDLGVFTEATGETTAAKKGWLRMSLETDGDDGTTGIKEITTEEQSRYDDDAFYNLSGVRVTNPQKGIYIRNGKKYIFK